MSSGVSFGIDLGTTNSCISMIHKDSTIPEIIPLKYGETIPSCVMLTEDNQIVVGKEAYKSRYEQSTIYSVKRMMGTDNIIHLKNGECERDLTPVEVSAEILKEIVKKAEEYVGDGLIHDVTITVPAHFNDNQRRDTKMAGELAGLNVVSIINEPTSAGLLYGLDKANGNQTILVYDLGGGTFDVSILKVAKEFRKFPLLGINMNNEYNKTAINILGNDGDVHLGGDDIDAAITDYIVESLAWLTGDSIEKVHDNLEEQCGGLEHLKLRVEQAKKSGCKTVKVDYNGHINEVNIASEEVEEKCYRPIFNRTYELITRAMASAGVLAIDNIVLVGGSTKSKFIRKMIRDKFPNINIMSTFEPDLSVGLGASISSASVLGLNDIASITDVVPMSIGIILTEREGSKDKVFSKVLVRDRPLPCIERQEYELHGDSNSVLIIDIRQGESVHNLDELVKIGELKLSMSQFKNGSTIIEYKCDLNGVLSVSVLTDNGIVPVDIHYTANESVPNKSDISILDKGQLFFYRNRRRKLEKAGLSKEIVDKFTPDTVLEGFDVADSVVNNLINSNK